MSTKARLPSAVEGAPADFANVSAHASGLMIRFSQLYAQFWQSDVVPPPLKEMTRLRNARITDCGY